MALDGFRRAVGGASGRNLKKVRCRLNLIQAGHTYPLGRRAFRTTVSGPESNQDEIDQGDQGRTDAGGDQGVVGADVALRIVRGLAGFLGHPADLGQGVPAICEAGHI